MIRVSKPLLNLCAVLVLGLVVLGGCQWTKNLVAQDTGDVTVDRPVNAIKRAILACDSYRLSGEITNDAIRAGKPSQGQVDTISQIHATMKPLCLGPPPTNVHTLIDAIETGAHDLFTLRTELSGGPGP